jgi:8-oxo-dGTP pyrophosphatase MutT (NUDIX family)
MKRAFLTLLYKLYSLQWIFTRPTMLGVRLLLVQDGKVLLVKHTYQPHWYLVGGGIKRGETPVQAARREAREESGAELGDLELFGIFSQFIENRSDHIIVFVCTDFTFTGRRDFEIESVQLFAFDNLPDNVSPGCRHRIEEFVGGSKYLNAGMW